MTHSTSVDPADLPGDIHAAAELLGGVVAAAEGITTMRSRGGRHLCFKLQLADGRTVKGRFFHSLERRERVTALAPRLRGLPFSRILGVHGSVTIEEWIDGTPVRADALSPDGIGGLARVLVTLHLREAPGEAAHAESLSRRLKKQLGLLVDDGYMGSQVAAALHERALENEADGLRAGIIHTDYTPRNMIARGDGEIWIVDNEGMRHGALDYDVARCWQQWPMTPTQREAFCQAYAEHRSLEAFLAHEVYWSIVAQVHSARFHLRHQQPIDALLEPLERTARGDDVVLWAERP
jgi:hypothetical protein